MFENVWWSCHKFCGTKPSGLSLQYIYCMKYLFKNLTSFVVAVFICFIFKQNMTPISATFFDWVMPNLLCLYSCRISWLLWCWMARILSWCRTFCQRATSVIGHRRRLSRRQCRSSLTNQGETWCHDIEMLSTLLALCEGNPPVTGGFP